MPLVIGRQLHFVYVRNMTNVVLQCDDLHMPILDDAFIMLTKPKKAEQ